MEDQEQFELKIFQIISAAGAAKSNYMEAISAAKSGDFAQADSLLKEGDAFYREGHDVHFEMAQKEASGEGVNVTLILVHAEDQMMSAELTRTMAEELIALYQERKS